MEVLTLTFHRFISAAPFSLSHNYVGHTHFFHVLQLLLIYKHIGNRIPEDRFAENLYVALGE